MAVRHFISLCLHCFCQLLWRAHKVVAVESCSQEHPISSVGLRLTCSPGICQVLSNGPVAPQ